MVDRPQAREELALALARLWSDGGPPEAIVCIGTDRATGDALGPLTGSFLLQNPTRELVVHGTLDVPVHATNLHDIIRSHPRLLKSRVLAVDASLGRPEEVGLITAGLGAIRPGAGVNKELPALGRYYVTGTVNIGGFMDYYVLQNTRLALVMRMAHTIAEAILLSLRL
nr:spore protease YyaC [Sulfobacillus harzensis]